MSAHTREVIDRWIAKYPSDRKRSAVLAALREVQHENGGYLTVELMDAVAAYLEMPPIAVYEVASFYSMLETQPVGLKRSMAAHVRGYFAGLPPGFIIGHIGE